jgi:hypothetical protein
VGLRRACRENTVIRAGQVLDLLSALADKSLLTVRHGPDGPRYRMLEIIRAYGQERLAEAGERDEVREEHARYFTRLAESSQDHLRGADQLDWLGRLAEDQDNMHAAIRGAVAAGDAGTAVRLAAALGWYWSLRSMKIEGAELIAAAVGLPGAAAAADAEHLAVAYAMGALLTTDTPMRETGADWFRLAAEAAGRVPDPVNPIMPLVGPLGRMFGIPDRGQGPAGPGTAPRSRRSAPSPGWPPACPPAPGPRRRPACTPARARSRPARRAARYPPGSRG